MTDDDGASGWYWHTLATLLALLGIALAIAAVHHLAPILVPIVLRGR